MVQQSSGSHFGFSSQNLSVAVLAAMALTGIGAQLTLGNDALAVGSSTSNAPSIFIRYQYDLPEVIALLEGAQGQPLSPDSAAARWLDEMGWRRWVNEARSTPFQFTAAMRAQIEAQDRFLKDSFSYQVGDAVWVPAERGEQPYGHGSARVNPRGKVTQILRGESETYFVVEVGVDNGSRGGMETRPGRYYDGSTGPVLGYTPNFTIEKKTYVYSLSEMERFNGAFRSQSVGSDTGATVDYTRDARWLAKLSQFKDKVIQRGLEIDFTAPTASIYSQQRRLVREMFNHFKMNRNAPSQGPLLGDVASGGGVCFTQACVLSHGVHAVGEPYGIRAMNINGATVNPTGGHGFVRLTMRGVDEAHVFDLVRNETTGATTFRGVEIKSNLIHFISDPGWADYGSTPDFFSAMPIEDAINPLPVNANRAIHELVQGKSFEDVISHYGGRGAVAASRDGLQGALFSGSKQIEFVSPRGQIAEAGSLESRYGTELSSLVDEARSLKVRVLAEPTGSARAVKTRILTELVEVRAAAMPMPGVSADGVKILLTEYLFRAVR